jgi:mannose-6-phosphate isomerase-like protein (cupin superfamily)
MTTEQRLVFSISDVPLLESPDRTMQDSVMVTDKSCGAQQYTAGLFFVRPGTRGHADQHDGQEELYYIISGEGKVVVDDIPHPIQEGDVVFIPDGATHYLVNDGPKPLALFWALPTSWSKLAGIQQELSTWREVDVENGRM